MCVFYLFWVRFQSEGTCCKTFLEAPGGVSTVGGQTRGATVDSRAL